MNWFTNRQFGTVTDQMDHCEHLKVGDQYHRMDQENDSFGVVGQWAGCEACCNEAVEAEGAKEVSCNDCRQIKPKRDTYLWCWYDFYAAQGDTPLCICNDCLTKPKHQQRIAQDEADRRWEMGEEQDYDND